MRALLAAVCLLAIIPIAACGGSEPDPDARASEIAAGVEATLTAGAEVPAQAPTVVVTAPPPTVAATGVDMMSIHLEADGSGDLATLEEALVL